MRSQNIRERTENQVYEHNNRVLQANIASREACEPDFIFSEEAKQLVNEALASMKPQTREIFILSREFDQTYKDIATNMNISVKAVEYHISKALKILRSHLKDYHLVLLTFIYL